MLNKKKYSTSLITFLMHHVCYPNLGIMPIHQCENVKQKSHGWVILDNPNYMYHITFL